MKNTTGQENLQVHCIFQNKHTNDQTMRCTKKSIIPLPIKNLQTLMCSQKKVHLRIKKGLRFEN